MSPALAQLPGSITDMTAVELSAAIRGRRVSCREVMEASLARIEVANPTLKAPPTGDLREDVRVELVAKLAADRYLCFKHADLFERAAMLDRWARRRGQIIHPAATPGPEVVPSTA